MTENTIKIVLPVFEKNLNLTEDERKIYKILSKTMLKSISEIAPHPVWQIQDNTVAERNEQKRRCEN